MKKIDFLNGQYIEDNFIICENNCINNINYVKANIYINTLIALHTSKAMSYKHMLPANHLLTDV